MNMKEHILTALREKFNDWEELLARLSEEQITTPLVPSHWLIKDVMAHLWAWQQRSIARVDAGQFNREPEMPRWIDGLDLDSDGATEKVNAWLYEQNRALSLSEVHRNWSEGFRRMLESAEQIAERDMLDASRYAWLDGHSIAFVLVSSYDHHQEHYEKLLVWLGKHGEVKSAR